ncbi:hypothetical protein NK8_41720 [Caballeronia sp. NK8]|nr:hypothetical protein NK8_41720 [Caballeronia sp. NK8]
MTRNHEFILWLIHRFDLGRTNESNAIALLDRLQNVRGRTAFLMRGQGGKAPLDPSTSNRITEACFVDEDITGITFGFHVASTAKRIFPTDGQGNDRCRSAQTPPKQATRPNARATDAD